MISKKILSIIFLIFAFVFVVFATNVQAAEQKLYVLTLKYDSGSVTLENIILTQGVFSPVKSEGAYRLDVLSFNGSLLYSEKFNFNLEVFPAPLQGWFDKNGTQIYIPTQDETQKIFKQTTKELLVPYFPTARQINIYDAKNAKALGIDVGYFAQVCGDKICEPHESYESCPADCPLVDKIAPQKIKGTGSSLYLITGIAVVVFGIVAFAYWRIERRKRLMEY